jgi:hypothetical protein
VMMDTFYFQKMLAINVVLPLWLLFLCFKSTYYLYLKWIHLSFIIIIITIKVIKTDLGWSLNFIKKKLVKGEYFNLNGHSIYQCNEDKEKDSKDKF